MNVKSIEFYSDGTVKRIEFYGPTQEVQPQPPDWLKPTLPHIQPGPDYVRFPQITSSGKLTINGTPILTCDIATDRAWAKQVVKFLEPYERLWCTPEEDISWSGL